MLEDSRVDSRGRGARAKERCREEPFEECSAESLAVNKAH